MNRLGMTVWFTGLSGAGKSTIAQKVAEELRIQRYKVEILDGDVVRQSLTKGLGFSKEDRDENIRRIGFVAEMLTRHGIIVLVPVISPYRAVREEIRQKIDSFVEVYVDTKLSTCEQRDVKGLYQKARAGEIKGFTGIDDPYEPPNNPEVTCFTDRESIEKCADRVLQVIELRQETRSLTTA
jgi:adenylylsulfate kinase